MKTTCKKPSENQSPRKKKENPNPYTTPNNKCAEKRLEKLPLLGSLLLFWTIPLEPIRILMGQTNSKGECIPDRELAPQNRVWGSKLLGILSEGGDNSSFN